MAVWEIVRITVTEGKQDEFESVVRSHLPVLKEDSGCLDAKMFRAIDKEGAILLCVQWESLEHHTEVFTKSEGFAKFAGAMAPFFTVPPEAFHADAVIEGF
ncbi:antibiotic biosynthesis monooxygenase family protein [Streptomyces sp. NPDC057245]|uniref:antibiotic biosynthesis monooxygenase family protein n=1 Tax=Streptomyces TaxID=1883 RepID=UPI001C1DF6C6|nr:antibiotic biosynthesis monooxygenase family protein [Streptomyces sp. A108]MBU6529806.1 antibiotic biosynthesis monooxygenase [Streptomyces sp. A108]